MSENLQDFSSPVIPIPASATKSLPILIARPDRLGDVVLSTPVFEALRRQYPNARLTLLVREAIAPVVRGLPGVDETLVFDPEGRHSGLRGLFRLAAELRKKRFRIAVVLQSHWKVGLAVLLAGIRSRVGPLSKPHSWICYNRGVRQRRSLVEMHEADYNLELLKRLGIRVPTRSLKTRVSVSSDARAFIQGWLIQNGVNWDPRTGAPARIEGSGRSFIAVHPGMAGSALNWPEENYLALVRALIREGFGVILTGGPTEGALLDRLTLALEGDAASAPSSSGRWLRYGGPGTGAVDRLAALYEACAVVVAPSTGPLHLAVALGKPVVSFYPPIRVQSVVRWGPYVEESERRGVMVPEVYCGEDFTCRGNVCNHYPCMKSLSVAEAMEKVHDVLGGVR